MKLINWSLKNKLSTILKNPKFILGSSLVFGGLAYFKLWLPLTNLGIPCPFYKVTGHFCPGCGITRAITALLEGDLTAAWQNNLLLFVVPLVFVAYFTLKHFRLAKLAEVLLYVTIVLAMLYGVLRNFTMFSFLAPIPLA